jgi:starch synthase (maltosyl-transferring)
LTEYVTELTQTGLRDFFRPHFFVNTPDINPLFLQSSGRAGFLIRAALAATLSGLWGMYAGFELCESAALPGREEYLDSEKYELRPRPDRAPGDIVDEIAQLNRLRRAEPALQRHVGLEFHNAYNDNIIYYSKEAAGEAGRILVAVNLDPHRVQAADFEVPLWLLGLSDWESVAVHNLLSGEAFRWTGKMQRVTLTPEHPYAIWRIAAGGEA